MRVLIIDDSRFMRESVQNGLNRLCPGWTITSYDPIEWGVPGEGFPLFQYDLVVMDYELAEAGNGLDWYRMISCLPGCPDGVLISADADDGMRRKAKRAGLMACVAKDQSLVRNLIHCVGRLCGETAGPFRSSAPVTGRNRVTDLEIRSYL